MSNLFQNLLDITMTDPQLTQFRDGITQAQDAAPFLIGLTTEQRQTIPKIAAGNLNFVQDSLSAMQDNSDMLPAYMNNSNLATDLTLYQQLDPLVQLVGQLYEKLRDTQMMAGSEAYISALAFYRMVEAAAKAGLPGADTVYEQLKQRFEGQGPQSGGDGGDGAV